MKSIINESPLGLEVDSLVGFMLGLSSAVDRWRRYENTIFLLPFLWKRLHANWYGSADDDVRDLPAASFRIYQVTRSQAETASSCSSEKRREICCKSFPWDLPRL